MDNNNTWNSALILGKKLIDKKMEVIQQRVENNQEVEGEYLTYLLSNTQISTKDVYGSITELLLAGMDTVWHKDDILKKTCQISETKLGFHSNSKCL